MYSFGSAYLYMFNLAVTKTDFAPPATMTCGRCHHEAHD